ncbi:hypothetical protein ACFSQ3_04825 [Sphingobacterium corticis]|uniref:TonB-dependent receptor plug domain-containing protein n=1 Tax=Sphingobacterium corticis TaxID=1812823 RepID=A0ABW5NKA2_9SPHI
MLKYLHTIAVFFWVGFACAQSIEERLEKSSQHAAANQQEKIYVQTDRNNYTAGETVWYKTYNTIGINNFLSTLSGINYIELIDPKNRIVMDQRIQLGYGLGSGNLVLADTLIEGTYRLRAYTNWMRNDSTDYFYEKPLVITNGRTDNILTKTDLITNEKGSFVAIQLETVQGNAVPKTSVRFEVSDGGEIVQKGSERTDETGLLLVKVTEKNQGKDLILTFTSPDKRPVTKVIHTAAIKPKIVVQILPEGGYILAGELNNIGFKALGSNGLGAITTLEILNAKQEVVGSAKTNHLGMGSTSFFPLANENYEFRATSDDGQAEIVEVPVIHAQGLSLITNNNNADKLFVQVNLSEDRMSDKPIFVVLHHLGNPFYASKQSAARKNLVFSIPKENIPSGISTITVLDESMKPLLERPIYIEHVQDLLSLNTTANQNSYGLREKVDVSLLVGNEKDSTRQSALSASVINLSKLRDTADYQSNILSALLVESDLQGFIEQPGYYFSAGDRVVKLADLDKLLLTQGWRKYDWNQSDDQNREKLFEAEQGLSIKGYTKKIGRKAAAPLSEVQLISTDDFTSFLDTISSEDGYFEFKDLLFADSAKFMISAKNQKGKNNIDITLEEFIPPAIHSAYGTQNDLNTLYLDELIASKRFFNQLEQKGLMSKTIDIDEVVVTRKQQKVPEYSRNLNGPGNADQSLTWEELEKFSTLDMALNGRFAGVYFQGGIPYNTRSRAPMQIVWDGMYVEGDMLSSISVQDVASIEILRNVNYTAVYGQFGSNGLIIITSKRGSEGRMNYIPKGILSLTAKGLSAPKTFYKPTYEAPVDEGFSNDLRTTIHWEPFLASDENGKASFDFFTSDESGRYRVIIEGIDLNGRIGRQILDFNVR